MTRARTPKPLATFEGKSEEVLAKIRADAKSGTPPKQVRVTVRKAAAPAPKPAPKPKASSPASTTAASTATPKAASTPPKTGATAKAKRAPAGNAGKGRPTKDPTDYEPNETTKAKRVAIAELLTPQVGLAVETIKKGAEGTADRTQLSAANMILDRVYGRPAQEHVFVGDDDKAPIRVDSGVLRQVKTEDLLAAAKALVTTQGLVRRTKPETKP